MTFERRKITPENYSLRAEPNVLTELSQSLEYLRFKGSNDFQKIKLQA